MVTLSSGDGEAIPVQSGERGRFGYRILITMYRKFSMLQETLFILKSQFCEVGFIQNMDIET